MTKEARLLNETPIGPAICFYARAPQLIYMDPSTLLRKKPVALLILLNDANQTWHISKLAKHANATYVHTAKLLLHFEEGGFVSFKKTGRLKTVSLTEKGAAVASATEALMEKLSPPTSQRQTTPNEKEKKQQSA